MEGQLSLENIYQKIKDLIYNLKDMERLNTQDNGDGKATLKSVIREYLMSENVNLGIKSSRSLAIIDTGEKNLQKRIRERRHISKVNGISYKSWNI